MRRKLLSRRRLLLQGSCCYGDVVSVDREVKVGVGNCLLINIRIQRLLLVVPLTLLL
jgi:hypothetical protein